MHYRHPNQIEIIYFSHRNLWNTIYLAFCQVKQSYFYHNVNGIYLLYINGMVWFVYNVNAFSIYTCKTITTAHVLSEQLYKILKKEHIEQFASIRECSKTFVVPLLHCLYHLVSRYQLCLPKASWVKKKIVFIRFKQMEQMGIWGFSSCTLKSSDTSTFIYTENSTTDRNGRGKVNVRKEREVTIRKITEHKSCILWKWSFENRERVCFIWINNDFMSPGKLVFWWIGSHFSRGHSVFTHREWEENGKKEWARKCWKEIW